MGSTTNFRAMIEKATPAVSAMLNNFSFIETAYTTKIETLAWPNSLSCFTHMRKTYKISAQELNTEIERKCGKDDKMNRAITVRMMNVGWMLRNKYKFLELTRILNSTEYQPIFVTEFVTMLLD